MGPKQVIELIKKNDKGYHNGIEEFNELRQAEPGVVIDLRGKDLSGRQLWYSIQDGPITGIDLRNVKINGLNLKDADMKSPILTSKQLAVAIASGAVVEDARIEPVAAQSRAI
jgi:uncharacterized protein YjbI with pentapeptide repeats